MRKCGWAGTTRFQKGGGGVCWVGGGARVASPFICIQTEFLPCWLRCPRSLLVSLSAPSFATQGYTSTHPPPPPPSLPLPLPSPLSSLARVFVLFFSFLTFSLSLFILFFGFPIPQIIFQKKNKRTQRFKSAVVPRPLYSPRVIVTTSIFIICIFSLFLSHFQFPCISILACKFASTLGFFTLLLQTYFMNNWCDTHMVKGFSLQEISEEGGRLVVSHFTALTFSIAERHGWSRRELHC